MRTKTNEGKMKLKIIKPSELKEDCCRICNKLFSKELKKLVELKECYPICDKCMDKICGDEK